MMQNVDGLTVYEATTEQIQSYFDAMLSWLTSISTTKGPVVQAATKFENAMRTARTDMPPLQLPTAETVLGVKTPKAKSV